MYDEIIVAQLEEKGYEYPQQIIDDFLEGRLMFGNDPGLHNYLHYLLKVGKDTSGKVENPTNPMQVRNTLKNR